MVKSFSQNTKGKQKEGQKEKLQDKEDRRRNIKIWVIEDLEGEVKVNVRENIL